MKKRILLALLIVASLGHAQPFYKHFDVGLSIGSSHYSGEIANGTTISSLTEEFRGQSGIQFNYHVTNKSTVGAELSVGKWYASDANHQNLHGRNFYAESDYFILGINYRYRFFTKDKRNRWHPYLGAGFCFNMFTTEVFGEPDGAFSPNPDQAFNQGTSFGFTFLPGLKFKISDRASIGGEVWLAFFGNDDIDNLVYSKKEADKIGSFRLVFNYKLLR